MAERVKTDGRRGNPWLTTAWTGAIAIILLTPLIAMQFTDEVNWTVSDFVFAGLILVGAGVAYELAARAGGFAYQGGAVTALGTGVVTLWVTGAVGIIGSENNPGNLLYVGTVALAIAAAIIARGRAARMVWAMGLTALATLCVPVMAYNGIAEPAGDAMAPGVFIATGVLTAGWALSAFFFRTASKT